MRSVCLILTKSTPNSTGGSYISVHDIPKCMQSEWEETREDRKAIEVGKGRQGWRRSICW